MKPTANALSDFASRLAAACARLPVMIDALLVACVCVVIALLVFGAWPLDLAAPFASGGDSDFDQFLLKTLITQGWYASNPDVGAPFGSPLFDFPIPEPTSFLIVRVLGWFFSSSPFVLFNLFYLTSFATCAIAARWAFASLGIGRLLAMTGSVLFTILPYHFLRLPHLFLSSYFSAAILACYALRLAMYRAPHLRDTPTTKPGSLLLLALAAGAGVYYAFFGCVFLALGAVIGAVQSRRATALRVGAAYIAVVMIVIVASLLPTELYQIAEGENPLVAHRLPQEAEIYGMRITQLLLPTMGHRIGWLGDFTAKYNASAPLINENSVAALGFIGGFGLIVALAIWLTGYRSRFPLLAAAGALAAGGILFATIGGFGSLFAWLVTPEIRALNRISVFIGFFAILATLVLAGGWLGTRPRPLATALFCIALLACGWIDEIPVHAIGRVDAAAFRQQKGFFDRVQISLEPGASVYELPYMAFPESIPTGNLRAYELMTPYLHTQGLRWSFGGMHGRAADIWNEQVSSLEGPAFIGALSRAGFGAIYVDRRGYTDHGAAIDRSLAQVLGAPIVEDASHDLAVYPIPRAGAAASARPFVVVGPGRGWYPWGKDAGGGAVGRSKGDADLVVANPNRTALPFIVQFNASASLRRTLKLRYGELQLGEYPLEPGVPRAISLSFAVQPGVSRIDLATDVPASADAHDARPSAFSFDDLAYGVSR